MRTRITLTLFCKFFRKKSFSSEKIKFDERKKEKYERGNSKIREEYVFFVYEENRRSLPDFKNFKIFHQKCNAASTFKFSGSVRYTRETYFPRSETCSTATVNAWR